MMVAQFHPFASLINFSDTATGYDTEYWHKHDADFKYSTGVHDSIPAPVLDLVGNIYRGHNLRLEAFVYWLIKSCESGSQLTVMWPNPEGFMNEVTTELTEPLPSITILSKNNKFALPQEFTST